MAEAAQQRRAIDDVNAHLGKQFRLFQGIEANIDAAGALDLSDEEAASILAKIEQASGRAVEATRKVDPDLIGGIVLQAGSLRVDASVRGRLNRLRHELVTRS